MKKDCFNFNVDKLELKYSIEQTDLFDKSLDDLLRETNESIELNDFTFKRRTQINHLNRAKDKYLYYRHVFSVLYKSEYVFEIYYDPYNPKVIRDEFIRLRVLNSALYQHKYSDILESFENTFKFKYEGYTQVDIAFDAPFNIQKQLNKYFLKPDKYSINYNRRELIYVETFGKEYRDGSRDFTIYLRHKADNTKQDTVIYNKSKEIADKGKDFLLRIVDRISNGKDVYRMEIQLNEKSRFVFNRFRLSDKAYLEILYTEQFNKMLDIREIEITRNGNKKKRSRCKKIDFLSEIKNVGKKTNF